MVNKIQSTGITTSIWHFVLHLRWHYQLFILSGGFLLGGFLSKDLLVDCYIFQFLNVHLLLFGGATAYNSFWDKDEGPIGGLKNPPKMGKWMRSVALLLQAIGLVLALPVGRLYSVIYITSIAFFWLYSSPVTRWKAQPLRSFIAIGFSTGFNAVLLGYLAAGNKSVTVEGWVAALGAMFLLLSLYPLSQLYQRADDRNRGDRTFAVVYGSRAVLRFYEISFLTGIVITMLAIARLHFIIGILFGVTGITIGLTVRLKLLQVLNKRRKYDGIMRIKYGMSLAFITFLVAAIIIKHSTLVDISKIVAWLLQ